MTLANAQLGICIDGARGYCYFLFFFPKGSGLGKQTARSIFILVLGAVGAK